MSDDPWDFNATSPKSVQIANELERRIRSGEYPPEYPIYEVRLTQEFGVARVTARKATVILRDRGLIFTVRGMGSFVASPDSWQTPEPQ
jgi:DNA-binding GntR family transcriptional regulator